MRSLSYLVDVPDLRTPDSTRRRVAGVLADGATLAVASMRAGEAAAPPEFEFSLGEAIELAQACLSGHPRALTTPGLSRKLSATVAILFRVAVVAGAVHSQEDDAHGATGHLDDQPEAGGNEDPGD